MKPLLIYSIIGITLLLSCNSDSDDRYLFFLHNRFLETHRIDEVHPEYGKVEYEEILSAFRNASLHVISEQREGNVNAREYAIRIVQEINKLIEIGISPSHITIVGTSKGGYIAQYVSTLARNTGLNFVFIACYRDSDINNIPEINYCGNILNIYDKSDIYGVSTVERMKASTCDIEHFKEIELNTGMGHGFIFVALPEWIEPTIQWAQGNFE